MIGVLVGIHSSTLPMPVERGISERGYYHNDTR